MLANVYVKAILILVVWARECRHIWSPPGKVTKSVCCEEGGTLGGHCYEKWCVEEADTPANTERRIKERCVFEVCLHWFTLSLHSVLFYQSRRCWGTVCAVLDALSCLCLYHSCFLLLSLVLVLPFYFGRPFIGRPGLFFFCLHSSSQVLKYIMVMVKAKKIFCCMYIP